MLIRNLGDAWYWVRQQDHAQLAAKLAESLLAPPQLPGSLQWPTVVRAIAHHDDGWFERDAAPPFDVAAGRERAFDEWPMTEATAIWRDSVRRVQAITLQPAAAFQPGWDRRMYEWIWCALSVVEQPLSREQLREQYAQQVGLEPSLAALDHVLAGMQHAGVIVHAADGYLLDRWHRARSALSTLWVSRHFDHLAKTAAAHRAHQPQDVAACTAFQMDHLRWTRAAETASTGLLSPDEFAAAAEMGYRATQFFDVLSLELCLHRQQEPHTIAISGWPTLDWRPGPEWDVQCAPWIWRESELNLTAPARRVPKAGGDAEPVSLTLRLSPA